MTRGRPAPPEGDPPPASVQLGHGAVLDLATLAGEICRRYRGEFPDEKQRYGAAGEAWCVHDNQYLLHWAAEAVNGYVDMSREVAWLASVLEAREFPLDRLARNLDIAGSVVREHVTGGDAKKMADVLRSAAEFVRSHGSFLT